MDSPTIDLNLQKLEYFIADDDKIVTWRWLSYNLGISINDSKILLNQYVTDNRNLKPNSLGITYVICGKLRDNGEIIKVVKESELERTEKRFTEVFSKEIYSIQKSKDVDLNIITMVDSFNIHHATQSPALGSIVGANCVKSVFKEKKIVPKPPPVIKGKSTFFSNLQPKSAITTKTNNIKVNTADTATKETVIDDKSKNTGLKLKQNGLTSFLNSEGKKPTEKPKETDPTPKLVESPVEEKEVEIKEKSYKDLLDVESDSEDGILEKAISISKENQKPKQSKKRQRKQQKKSIPSPKRRKRIVEQNESDDDMFANHEEDNKEVMELSEEEIPNITRPLLPKNKKRKFVDQTFEDEEGFTLTRKEWVEISSSDDEVKVIKSQDSDVKKAQKHEETTSEKQKNEVKEVVTNGKLKVGKTKKPLPSNQSTLMNFFKKK